MRTAEAVVVGAGIMGCSIAYHLARAGVSNIVVVEKDEIGRGATADAAGGIRLQFSSETNIRLAQLSLEVWENFQELFGIDIGLHQQGYLFLLQSESDASVFRGNLELQQRLGVPARWVSVHDIQELNPAIQVDDILGGTYCDRDGWVDPYSATMGYAQAARRSGVTILEGVAVEGLQVDSGALRGVQTTDGPIATERLIIAAGPHTADLVATIGVAIPIQPFRRMSFVTEEFRQVPATVPMTIDFSTSLYFHPEGDGFLFGMANPDEPAGFNRVVDQDWMVRTVEELCRRAPVFEEARVRRGWAGWYDITPDDNPALGQVEECEGLFVAAGFSGHGFMQGPAVGQCLAELITTGASQAVDISDFDPSRFGRGQLRQEHNVV